jgi:mono/diheme cytochrome c family protein
MPVRITIGCALAALLLFLMSGPRLSGQGPQETQPPTTKVLKPVPIKYTKPSSGPQMFKEYCASCHGGDGRGNGPAVVFLKTPPPDLRTMTQRNNGKYPAEKVVSMLNFGPGSKAHGALDMPTWGPLFRSLDSSANDRFADLRVYNLTGFIESIQEQ